MKRVLVLCTSWSGDYWESNDTIPYLKTSMKLIQIQHLKSLKSELPLAGIGVYTKGKDRDFTSQPPCFLIIKDITENERGELQFDFQYVSKMREITSSTFLDEMKIQSLISTLPGGKVLSTLKRFGIKPPAEWQKLLEAKTTLMPTWQDWIGKRFQEILQTISNNDYEDRIAEIFRALGFEVEQLGYKKEGEYPDGIAYAKDFAIIYDCKNRSNYFLTASDKRAIITYIQDAKRRIKEQRGIERVYFAIIAHSYGGVESINDIEKETFSKGFLLTSEAMLYLLYKKISMGPSFLLVDFEKLASTKIVTIESIEKIYSGRA